MSLMREPFYVWQDAVSKDIHISKACDDDTVRIVIPEKYFDKIVKAYLLTKIMEKKSL